MERKKLIQKKSDLWVVPNLLGYFRIILVPVYLYIYFRAQTAEDFLWAALVLGVSGISDMLDGRIARKFHLITEFGKVLDPIADKLTQVAVALSLSFRFPAMRYLLILLVGKDLFLAAMGFFMFRRGKMISGAQWYGKLSTAVFYVLIFLLLVDYQIPYISAEILIGICIVLMFIALCGYALLYRKMLKGMPVCKKEENDKVKSGMENADE